MGVWSRDLRDAADEIETLRSTVTDCRIEIERLRAERDEARREICDKVSAYSPSVTAKQWARERGWDCFKEASDDRSKR
jgi:hypothetical protein